MVRVTVSVISISTMMLCYATTARKATAARLNVADKVTSRFSAPDVFASALVVAALPLAVFDGPVVEPATAVPVELEAATDCLGAAVLFVEVVRQASIEEAETQLASEAG